MKKITFLILLSLLIINSCKTSNSKDYNALITEARELYKSGDYENSGEKYQEAFEAGNGGGSPAHHYEAARAWALAGNEDAAFNELFEISENGSFSDLEQISKDDSFNSLRKDERWMTVLRKVSDNKKQVGAQMAEIAATLEIVNYDDQKYRQEAGEIMKKYGPESEEVRAHWELIRKQDSINLLKVEKILEEHGWLGADRIGRNANQTLFLVIQHADPQTREKYLPMLREAVKNKNASPSDLALLEDRVTLDQGKKQIYGSQIGVDRETGEYYVRPLQDPENVNRRRAEVGLEPIENYISHWNLSWDVEAYKKQLPEIEAKD